MLTFRKTQGSYVPDNKARTKNKRNIITRAAILCHKPKNIKPKNIKPNRASHKAIYELTSLTIIKATLKIHKKSNFDWN